MRLATLESDGTEMVAIVCADTLVIPVNELVQNAPRTMLAYIAAGPDLWYEVDAAMPASAQAIPLDTAALRAPIPRPTKNVVCLGNNYRAHLEATQRAQGITPRMPDYPVFATKAPTSVIGPGAPIEIDAALTTHVDWEAELAIIIGRRSRDIPNSAAAYQYIFGYTAANDVTARDLQERVQGNQQQWFRAKSLDTFCPLGPWIVTRDELPDPHVLAIGSRVNGQPMQASTTADFYWTVPQILHDLSAGTTLEPGDVILTGTPWGVGNEQTPRRFLRPGDYVEVEIDGVGVLRNPVTAHQRQGTNTQSPPE